MSSLPTSVPSQGRNPNTFYFQRIHQLIRAVELLLPTAYSSAAPFVAPTQIPVVVAGGSVGGYMATLMATFFPNRIHGAFAGGSSGSLQRLLGLHDTHTFSLRSLGWNGEGRIDLVRESQWAVGFHHLNTSWENASFVEQWLSGDIHRPHSFHFNDEDIITSSGAEWLNIVRPPGNQETFGKVDLDPLVGGQPGPGQPGITWAISDKSCHAGENKGFRLPQGGPLQFDSSNVVELIILDALASYQANPTVPVPTGAAPDTSTGQVPGWVVDPYDSTLNRPLDRQGTAPSHTVAPRDDTIISLASGFPKNGHGLGLAALAVADGHVYAGATDGIVTKFDVDELAPGMPFVERCHSKELGSLINGVAVTANGQQVVVTTYRAIYLLDAADLSVQAQTDATYNGDWKHTNPRRLLLADVYAASPGAEIIYVTMHGGLFVRSADLATEITNFPEPGIIDVAVDPEGFANLPMISAANFSQPIFIMSSRGHLASLELGSNGFARLRALSEVVHGSGIGLEFASWPGIGSGLTAFYQERGSPPGAHEDRSFHIFDADLLDRIGSTSTVGSRIDFLQSSRGGLDFAIYEQGSTFYAIVLRRSFLYVVDGSGAVVGSKALRTYGPAMDAMRVEVGELVSGNAGPEIVISTLAGHVVWFGIDQLLGGTGMQIPLTRVHGGIDTSGRQTNNTMAGAWAMATDLEGEINAVDQSGAQWSFGVDGDATLERQVKFFFGDNAVSPIMDLGHAGTLTGLVPEPFETLQSIYPLYEDKLNEFQVTTDIAPGAAFDPKWSHIQLTAWQRGLIPVSPPPVGQVWFVLSSFIGLADNFWLFTRGGDVQQDGAIGKTMSWSGEYDPNSLPYMRGWRNHVLRLDYDIANGEGDVQQVWGSGGEAIFGTGGPSVPPPSDFKDFRSDAIVAAHSWQSLRMGDLKGDGDTYAAMSTSGGSVLIMRGEGNPQPVELWESGDHGWGGLALAVGQLDADAPEEVVFGTLFRHTDRTGDHNLDAALVVVGFAAGTFFEKQVIHLGDINLDPVLMPGYGIVGITIADVTGDHPGNEVVVTTLNGELYIFGTDGGAPINPTPLHASVHPGALGGCNSILVYDEDDFAGGASTAGSDYIFISSSQGLYRFDIRPPNL